MAKLTYVYRTEDISYVNVSRRQLPLVVSADNLMMLMDLNSKGLVIDAPLMRGKDLEEFTRKFNLFTDEDELRSSLEIDSETFVAVLNQCVQCVGCRRRVERLFYQLQHSGHPTLDPLVFRNNGVLTVCDEKLKTSQALGTLLYRHNEILNNILDNKLRGKPRCGMHSMDALRTRPLSEAWREVWFSMKNSCRDELAVIETKELYEVLEDYLKKHKFCQGCRTKIEKAYKILVGEATSKEKGYVSALYANIKKCHPDKHVHVMTNKIEFLDQLIRRAEPEVSGNPFSSFAKQRERHAKTLEIAQEEVLTCVGMIMYERLRRIYSSLREEERACQLLAAVGVHALYRQFDTVVEQKQGISNLELLYQEISRAEKAKEHKREQKKLKKKKKKNEKKNNCRSCDKGDDAADAVGLNLAETADDVAAVEYDDEDLDENADEVASLAATDEFIVVSKTETDPMSPHELLSLLALDDEKQRHLEAEAEASDDFEFQMPKKKRQQKQKQKGTTAAMHAKVANNNKKLALSQQQQQKHKQLQQQSNATRSRSSSCSAQVPIAAKQTAAVKLRVSTNISNETMPDKCSDCLVRGNDCPCENDVKDSGYGSEPSHGNSRTSSIACSPNGSEVCCSEGLCNHEADEQTEVAVHCELTATTTNSSFCSDHWQLHEQQHQLGAGFSLQRMLDDPGYNNADENEENLYIPQEVVLEYQCQFEKVQRQRQQLRETLKQNFARLCMRNRMVVATKNCN